MTSGEYRLALAAPRRRHDEPMKYIVYVLWLIGFSARSIGKILGMRPKQVAGIVERSEYSGRSSMPDEERRSLLEELRAIRCEDGIPIDGGKLDQITWDILPAGGSQLRGPVRRKMR